MKQMKKQLCEVSAVRTVGFADAVADLGTHRMCGHDVPYSVSQVRQVLMGQHVSKRLLERIANPTLPANEIFFPAPLVVRESTSRRLKSVKQKGKR